MSTMPLQWNVDVNAVAHAPCHFSYEANASELEGLKRYAVLEDVHTFTAKLEIAPAGAGRFRASGTLKACIVQSSVVDLQSVPAVIDEHFSVEYWPEGSINEATGESLPFDKDLPEAIVGARIPIGEFLCELFVLSIEPYPRNEGDEFKWNPPRPEPEDSPFAQLSQLRRPKQRKE